MITKKVVKAFQQASKSKTQGYDTQAEVRRIENGVAWVHIPGGVDETPVRMTIDAKAGDTVQVRVSGGKAFLVGNATAPPTDDTTARQVGVKATDALLTADSALHIAEEAGGTATKYMTDISSAGVFVHEASSESVQPTDAGANGVHISDDVDIIRNGKIVASYGSDTLVGDINEDHMVINSNGLILAPDEDTYNRGQDAPRTYSKYFGLDEMVYDTNPVTGGAINLGFVSKINDIEITPAGIVYYINNASASAMDGLWARLGYLADRHIIFKNNGIKQYDSDGVTQLFELDSSGNVSAAGQVKSTPTTGTVTITGGIFSSTWLNTQAVAGNMVNISIAGTFSSTAAKSWTTIGTVTNPPAVEQQGCFWGGGTDSGVFKIETDGTISVTTASGVAQCRFNTSYIMA